MLLEFVHGSKRLMLSILKMDTPKIEQCMICLEDIIDQVVGIPEPCNHKFCFKCLLDWSQVRERERDKKFFMQIFFVAK